MGNPLRGIKDEMPLQPGESLSCHVLRAGRCSGDSQVLVIVGTGRGQLELGTALYSSLCHEDGRGHLQTSTLMSMGSVSHSG